MVSKCTLLGLALATLLAMAACREPAERFYGVQRGMSEREVVGLLGRPAAALEQPLPELYRPRLDACLDPARCYVYHARGSAQFLVYFDSSGHVLCTCFTEEFGSRQR